MLSQAKEYLKTFDFIKKYGKKQIIPSLKTIMKQLVQMKIY